jgi:hypothetical protein
MTVLLFFYEFGWLAAFGADCLYLALFSILFYIDYLAYYECVNDVSSYPGLTWYFCEICFEYP